MKILIVDDDIQIRTGLEVGIEWGKLGITEILVAEDGIEAMQKFKENLPEIVMTDIRMPGMNGLELSREIRKMSPSTRIIILSGYSEFEYARKALQYGVIDYLLKPVKIKELLSIITTVRDNIIEINEKEEQFKNHKKLFNEKFIEDILTEKITEKDLILKEFKKHFNIDHNGIVITFVLEFDNYLINFKNMNSEQKRTFYEEVKKIISSIFIEEDIIVNQLEDKFFIILKLKENRNSCSITNKLMEAHKILNKSLKERFGISVTMGVGSTGLIINLVKLYKESLKALSQKLYLGAEASILFEESRSIKSKKYVCNINEKELKENISRYAYEAASCLISKEYEALKLQSCCDRSFVKNICNDLRNILVRTIKEEGIDFDNLFGNNEALFDSFEGCETIESYKQWILKLYFVVLTSISEMKGISHNSLMLKAAEFIKLNYYRDITVEELGVHIQKNPKYFSHLFKKEFGVSFSEYCNKIRINEAKKLMQSSTLLSYEIASKVGFQDYKYFTQVFKKLEGYAPSEFRNGKRKNP